jgi:hypothetical protein
MCVCVYSQAGGRGAQSGQRMTKGGHGGGDEREWGGGGWGSGKSDTGRGGSFARAPSPSTCASSGVQQGGHVQQGSAATMLIKTYRGERSGRSASPGKKATTLLGTR